MSDRLAGVVTDALPHAVFLRRLAATRERTAEARLARAAFVTLRLVDLLQEAAPPPPTAAAAFHYQHGATARACQGLPADRTETAHLIGVVASTADVFHARDPRLLFPALFAYAHFLEDELRLEEALDVLETLHLVTGEVLRAEDRVSARLRTARVLRKLNRFDAAERTYDEAGELAVQAADRHSELLSRIGRADTLRGRGNLADAERSLREILPQAELRNDDDAGARAHQVLAVVLGTRGQPAEAIPHVWRAFQLYADEVARGRALADLGGMLLMVGDATGAERALLEAVQRGGEQDFATNALIELMNCASYRGDRVGFERWRERCEARREAMPPNVRVDLLLKTGIGRARFGQMDRATKALEAAQRAAEVAGLHEFVFRIERIRVGLEQCSQIPIGREQPVQMDGEVSAALASLRADTSQTPV